MSNEKQTQFNSPLGRTIGFTISVLLSGVLASAFVTEITVQGQLEWSGFYTKKTFWALIILMLIYLLYYTLTSSGPDIRQRPIRSVPADHSTFGQRVWKGMTSLPGWSAAMIMSLYLIYHYRQAHFFQEQSDKVDTNIGLQKNNQSELCDMKEAKNVAIKLFTDGVEDPDSVTIENIYCVIAKIPTVSWAIWARSPSQGRLIALIDEKTRAVEAHILEPHPPGPIVDAHRFAAIDFDGNGIDELVVEEYFLHRGYRESSLDILDGMLKPIVSIALLSENLGVKSIEEGGYEYRAEARFTGRNDKTIIEIIPKDANNISTSFFKATDRSVAVKKRTRFTLKDGKFSAMLD